MVVLYCTYDSNGVIRKASARTAVSACDRSHCRASKRGDIRLNGWFDVMYMLET